MGVLDKEEGAIVKEVASQASKKLDVPSSVVVITFIISLLFLAALYETTAWPERLVWMVMIILAIVFGGLIAYRVYWNKNNK